MSATATVRDLRNHFPKVRQLVEAEGEVVVTERGTARFRLLLHTPARATPAPAPDYWARLTASQPKLIRAAAARALHEENRGDR